jgi:hypothetical protein
MAVENILENQTMINLPLLPPATELVLNQATRGIRNHTVEGTRLSKQIYYKKMHIEFN